MLRQERPGERSGFGRTETRREVRTTPNQARIQRRNSTTGTKRLPQVHRFWKPHPGDHLGTGRKAVGKQREVAGRAVRHGQRGRRVPPQHHLDPHQRRRGLQMHRLQQGRLSGTLWKNQRLRPSLHPTHGQASDSRWRNAGRDLPSRWIPHREYSLGTR